MDYLKTAIPSELIAERGSNLVVINPGSANVRIGLAPQDIPLNVPHCIARYTTQVPKRNVQDQLLNSQVTTVQHLEREKAYDIIASLLKIPFLDEELANNSFQRKMGELAEELTGGRDDGRSNLGSGRSKGGVYPNGQGKPKKGRPTPRDAKKHRPSDQDFDYEDDPDLTS